MCTTHTMYERMHTHTLTNRIEFFAKCIILCQQFTSWGSWEDQTPGSYERWTFVDISSINAHRGKSWDQVKITVKLIWFCYKLHVILNELSSSKNTLCGTHANFHRKLIEIGVWCDLVMIDSADTKFTLLHNSCIRSNWLNKTKTKTKSRSSPQSANCFKSTFH